MNKVIIAWSEEAFEPRDNCAGKQEGMYVKSPLHTYFQQTIVIFHPGSTSPISNKLIAIDLQFDPWITSIDVYIRQAIRIQI